MDMTRREFLKVSIAAAAAGSLSARATLAGQAAPPPAGDGLPLRVLGRTRQSVTILGLGCGYISHDADEAATRKTIEAALEGGVRYFDTSPDYKESEVRLGPILSSVRDKIFLVTKTNWPDAKGVEQEFSKSLELLKTDHVDLLLQHGVGLGGKSSDTDIMLGKGGSLEFMRQLKKEGRARFIGMSIHGPFGPALKLLDAGDEWDAVMPFINYVSRAEINAEEQIVERVRPKNLGVVAMKVLGGQGQLAEDYDRAFRYALSVPGVGCALVGVHNAGEVKRAVQAAREFRVLTGAEMEETIRLGKEKVKAKAKEATLLQRHYAWDMGSIA
jgi:predicted aldo/keto reductase-like oxidoreductase